jgi:hypothetical protein
LGRAVSRRQLLGASIAALVAALSLPFERFAEWCKAWLGSRDPGLDAYLAAKSAEIDALYEAFGEQLSVQLWGNGPPIQFLGSVNPLRLT